MKRTFELEKHDAAIRAVAEIESGMIVGLGTGSTATYAVRELARRIADDDLRITAAATSTATEALARSLGIALRPMGDFSVLDVAIDGADEIDPMLRAIKGGGGALFREKIVAAAAARMIVIVDSSKPVRALGASPLPIEIHPLALSSVRARLGIFGCPVELRRQDNRDAFLTDQQAYICDVAFGRISEPEDLAAELSAIPGVMAHGLFVGLIDELIVGIANDQ